MTYCAAWKFNGNIHMIADTALTGVQQITRVYSSIGQLHENVGGKNVQEGILKIIAMHDTILMGYSGSVRWALAIADFLNSAYSPEIPLPLMLERVNASVGPFPRDTPVVILLGGVTTEGVSLYQWDSRKPNQAIPVHSFTSIGSLETYHVSLTKDMVALLAQRFSTNHFSLIVSLVQAYGIHENLIRQKVGGIVFGASLTPVGVEWQPDTSYLIYDQNLKDIRIVTCIARDNVLAVYSSFTREFYLFHHYLPEFSYRDWIDKWEEKLFSYFNERKSIFYSFIRKSDKNVVVIKVKSGCPDCKYFRITHHGGENYEFEISPELMKLLMLQFERPKRIPDDALPLGFSYYEA